MRTLFFLGAVWKSLRRSSSRSSSSISNNHLINYLIMMQPQGSIDSEGFSSKLNSQYRLNSLVLSCPRILIYSATDTLQSLPCLIYICPIKYLPFQYSTFKSKLKFYHQNHYHTIQSLYEYFEDRWVFGNEEIVSVFLVMEGLEGKPVGEWEGERREEMVSLALMETVEYLERWKVEVEISLDNVWCWEGGVKVSLIGLVIGADGLCPYCEYCELKGKKEQLGLGSGGWERNLFNVGILLLELVCQSPLLEIIDIAKYKVNPKQICLSLKSPFSHTLLKSSIHELITTLLSPSSPPADYSQYLNIIHQTYYYPQQTQYLPKQKQYISKRIHKDTLDVSRILNENKHTIIMEIDLERVIDLNLSNNDIGNIEFLGRVNCESLKRLNLSYNRIERVDVLTRFLCLERLYLSHNKIANIDGLAKANHQQLLILMIQSNKIRSIKALKHIRAPKIKKIWIYDNPIHGLAEEAKTLIEKLGNVELIY